jgi:hypothetical protein
MSRTMPERSLGKNHLVKLPLTPERIRSPTRSLAHAVTPQVLASIFALAFHKLEHHSFMHEL